MTIQSELYLYDVSFHNHTQCMQSNVNAINATQAKYLHNILNNARIAGNATCWRFVRSVTMETGLEQALFLAQTNARVGVCQSNDCVSDYIWTKSEHMSATVIL